ncbi:MAG: glycosyltransferase [Candidatus Gottesmanbacteria bacterium]|nr:glycosyltransferase [Candidatus Gottesmanbacteria bacterium]
MNIVIFSQTFPLYPTDGTAHFMYDFARGLSETGHTVFVLVPFHPDLKSNLFEGIHVVPFRYITPDSLHLLGYGRTVANDQKIPWFVYLLTPLYLLCGAIALLRLVHEERIDIINAHWIVPNGFCAAIVSRITGIPLVITLPGTDVYLAQTNPLARFMSRVAITWAREIVSNSPQRKKHVGVVIATAGRMVAKKGFEILHSIYPEIEIITNLPIDKFRRKLLTVDIFVAPSIRDKNGNLDDASLVVLEAMAAGCAVVVSDLPGYRMMIKNGKNGILFPPHDTKAMARAIECLRASGTLRQKMGTNARKTVASKYTHLKIAAAYLKIFKTYEIYTH